ncbi:amidase [Natronosporangium hydrolyticum]|uniref:Amidase n=1 Tax=Natronosporangium hydrolyticum TaxID=2811111 RepID=A0A895YMT4_9ACTN|nr:amidase [Natronosporangium hydrolyticum]QSB15996.1 amidase [Natronosporangium hydrolyticum]
MGELHDLTVLAQAAAIRRRELRARELVEHYLRRIEAHDPALGAFFTLTPEAALAAADEVDALAASDAEQLPPLAGVPIAIKDLVLTRGVRTTFGSLAFADHVPRRDADVVVALRGAGTISLGKTAASEFGISLYCETEVGPPTRNPWDPTQTAGGSSGGAGAAVAAGLVPAAHGNDGGGSVRIPAALCGLVGYKPSRGVVAGGPVGFGGFGLPTDGPLTRTVADAAALLDAMAVPVPGEPLPRPPGPPGGYLAAALRPEPGRRRIGVWAEPVLADAELAPACRAVLAHAVDQLTELGHEVVPVAPPVGAGVRERFGEVWRALALANPVPADREELLLPITRWLREQARSVSVADLFGALSALQGAVREGAARLAAQGVELLLSPPLASPQAPVGHFRAANSPAEDFAAQSRFSPYCAVYNLTGAPAVSLPLGQTEAGAPVGVMLAALPGEDGLLLQVAAQLEQQASWLDRHPAQWWGEGSATVNGG